MLSHRYFILLLLAFMGDNLASSQDTSYNPQTGADKRRPKDKGAGQMMRRTLATILAASLFFTTTAACTVCNLTPTEDKVTKRKITVQPLFYKEDSQGATGDFSNCTVTVEVNNTGQPKVGFYEEEVAGSGSQWRSAGWMAAIMGSFLLDRNVSDYKFSYEIAGYVDGPSAGGLMTSAVLAALLGDEINKNVTMTGTINPDGTIGPVGGIPQKIDGVKKAGKTKMLIPSGLRYQEDANTGEDVDLIEEGKKKGITVIEVTDIYEAYKELTGKDLPKAAGATKDKIELPKSVYDKVKNKTKAWYAKYETMSADYNALVVNANTDTEDDWMLTADTMAAEGDDYLRQGLVSSAYDQVASAYMYSAMAYQTKRVVQAYLTQGGVVGAENYLSTIKPSGKKMDAAVDDFKGKKAQSLADTMALAEGFGRLSMAEGLIQQAEALVASDAANKEEALANVILAANYYAIADYAIDWAKDAVSVGTGTGTAKPADKEKVLALSEALRKAAEANLDYFDNVVLKGWADAEGMSLDVARYNFMQNDFNYGFAVSSITGAHKLKDALGDTEARANAVLGNSLTSFILSSELIAKHYSLQVETDDNGDIVSIPFEKSMITMLDFAEDTAVENMNSASAAGALPVLAVIAFDGAKVSREGTADQKIDALGSYWNASMQGRLLTILAGMKVARPGSSGDSGFASVLGD
jgi:hypothetical protein